MEPPMMDVPFQCEEPKFQQDSETVYGLLFGDSLFPRGSVLLRYRCGISVRKKGLHLRDDPFEMIPLGGQNLYQNKG